MRIGSGHKRLARSVCVTYDDLILFNNKTFGNYVKRIYPLQLTVEKTSKSDDLANYQDSVFIIERNNRLSIMLNDQHHDFNFLILNVPSLSKSYHLALHMVFISDS